MNRLAGRNPRLLLDELTAKLEESGLATDTAQRVSTELPLESSGLIDFTARTVFGFDPGEVGSPTVAAVSSLGLFTAGAIVPLAPWFFTSGTTAIVISVTATAVASLIVRWMGQPISGPSGISGGAASAGDRPGRICRDLWHRHPGRKRHRLIRFLLSRGLRPRS